MEEIGGFNEGDTVFLDNLINKFGGTYREGDHNPMNTPGVIYGEDNAYDGRLLVKWSNGKSNTYLASNLRHAN